MRVTAKVLKAIIALLVVFYVVYGALNANSLYQIWKAKSSPQTLTDTNKISDLQSIKQLTVEASAPQTLQDVINYNMKAQKAISAKSDFQNNWLYIPRLGIQAPIQWDMPQDEVTSHLIDGLAQVAGTAHPDENGDILIAGHSSYYWWAKGDYKTIFAGLVGIKNDDEITVDYKGVVYIYKVTQTYQIGANDGLSLNKGGTNPKNLYLMTCVPVGTNLKRLIVRAEFEKNI